MARVQTARRIKAKPGFVTGQFADDKQYENLLERDFLQLLRFDPMVRAFSSQSIKIEYEWEDSMHSYVPDVLVHYHPPRSGEVAPPSALVEVKPSTRIEEPQTQQAAKFEAAARVCEREGWRFVLVTEQDIRTPRLQNANFLVRYLARPTNPFHVLKILEYLREAGRPLSIEQLLAGVCATSAERAKVLPDLWTLVAQRKLVTDLEVRLTTQSLLSGWRGS